MCESFAGTFKTLHAPCVLIFMNDLTNTDQLQTLVNALRQTGFRFILVEYNHLSVYDDVRKLLAEKYPEKPQFELRISGNNYHSLTEQINEAGKAWIMIPDFDLLFTPEYEDVCTAFNQRRDFFARNNVVLICFILEGKLKQAPVKIPDFWSLRSLEINLHIEMVELKWNVLPEMRESFEMSSIGGKTVVEKKQEIQHIENQIEATEPTNYLLLQALFSQLAQLFYDISDFSQASMFSQKALEMSQKTGDKEQKATSLNNLGQIYLIRGDFEKALDLFEQSLIIRREIGGKVGEGATLNSISQIYAARGDYNKALEFLEQSLKIRRETGDKSGEGTTLNNISGIYTEQGDYEKAMQFLELSLKIRQDLGQKAGEGITLNNMGQIFAKRGDFEKARHFLQLSLVIQREIGNKMGEGLTLHNMGQIYEASGDYQKALELLKQSLKIKREIDDYPGMAFTLFNLASICFDKKINQPEKAKIYLNECIEINRKIQNPKIMAAIENLTSNAK